MSNAEDFVKEDLGTQAPATKEKILVPIDLKGEDRVLSDLLLAVSDAATTVVDRRYNDPEVEDNKKGVRFGDWVRSTTLELMANGLPISEDVVTTALKRVKFHCADFFSVMVKDDAGASKKVTYWKSKIPNRKWRLVRDYKIQGMTVAAQ